MDRASIFATPARTRVTKDKHANSVCNSEPEVDRWPSPQCSRESMNANASKCDVALFRCEVSRMDCERLQRAVDWITLPAEAEIIMLQRDIGVRRLQIDAE